MKKRMKKVYEKPLQYQLVRDGVLYKTVIDKSSAPGNCEGCEATEVCGSSFYLCLASRNPDGKSRIWKKVAGKVKKVLSIPDQYQKGDLVALADEEIIKKIGVATKE